MKAWLAANPTRRGLRLPVNTRARGVRAILVASSYNCGVGSALHDLARDRLIRGGEHRERLRVEITRVLGAVFGGVTRDAELRDLHALEDTINAGPVGVELATASELVRALAGAGG